MGNLRSLFARRRRGSDRAVYIAVVVTGVFIGMSAWDMSHSQGAPVVPLVQFGTAADTPVPTAGPTPTAHRTGFVLTP